ncbi:hypothetical protein [Pseudomonas shirazensis]
MKKNSCFLIILTLVHFICIAQKNDIKIKYSIKNEKSFLYKEQVIDGDTIIGYGLSNKIFFKNKFNLKYYFYDDKIFLNNQLIYCFKNVQYFESLLFFRFKNREYLYIYPHYYGRVGPNTWSELGVLIEIKSIPIVKENIDYFEDYEVGSIMRFKKYKIVNLKSKICADRSVY